MFKTYFIWPLCILIYSIKRAWGYKVLAYIRNWHISLAYICEVIYIVPSYVDVCQIAPNLTHPLPGYLPGPLYLGSSYWQDVAKVSCLVCVPCFWEYTLLYNIRVANVHNPYTQSTGLWNLWLLSVFGLYPCWHYPCLTVHCKRICRDADQLHKSSFGKRLHLASLVGEYYALKSNG